MTSRLVRLLYGEELLIKELRSTPEYQKLARRRGVIAAHIKKHLKHNDMGSMIDDEIKYVARDLREFADRPSEISSLEGALDDLAAIKRGIANVTNPSKYRQTAEESYGHPKSRRGNLPYDEARRSFDSHYMRLQTLLKARLDGEYKDIIEVRRDIISRARNLYIQEQKKALGPENVATDEAALVTTPTPQESPHTKRSQIILIDPLGENERLERLVNLTTEEAEQVCAEVITFLDEASNECSQETYNALRENLAEVVAQTVTTPLKETIIENKTDDLNAMVSLYRQNPERYVTVVLWNAGIRMQAMLADESDAIGATVLPEVCDDIISAIHERVADKIKEIAPDADNSPAP